MRFIDRLIRSEVDGASLKTIRKEEEAEELAAYEEEMMRQEAMAMQQGMGLGAGKPLGPMGPLPMPMNLDHETMKIYLKPKTPDKLKLTHRDRFWIFSDEVCTSILTSNLDAKSQRRMERIIRQAKDLDGCNNVDNLIHDLQEEAYMIVISNKARSDLPDHIRERIVPSVGMSLVGDANASQKNTAERPRENRAIAGVLGHFSR